MTTSDTRGVSSERGEDWRARAACRGRWDDFDLDHIDRDGVNQALLTCHWCPVLTQCRDDTEQDTPQGVVQAGHVWIAKNGKAKIGGERKTCPECGVEFYATDPRRKYCDDACQRAAYSWKKRKAAKEAAG